MAFSAKNVDHLLVGFMQSSLGPWLTGIRAIHAATIAGLLAWMLSPMLESALFSIHPLSTVSLSLPVTVHSLTFPRYSCPFFMFTARTFAPDLSSRALNKYRGTAFYAVVFRILGRIYSLTTLFNLILRVSVMGNDYSEHAVPSLTNQTL
ncbi:uncharacterized protein BT62DRAFT_929979 [Guyanagaster necrorhizus]|uniref:Uncharacterized protein n=1 Tax=Guyanagaster necrorhizus TaxID=856835 RepID=A0A9P8AUW9_9AGAR|nr:uncharacterized protein BT62DRAFT_929979 [Guyanagaster necrorhizus MCA 3950]KAG7448908.1 hypothetical protein BT62DRAFT_929979 [Guyanagaster necrorhizus MCA 3950]